MEHVFICGGSRGIGRAMVKAFSDAGCKVSFSYCNSIAEAQSLSDATGALAIKADGRVLSQVQAACELARAEQGSIDTLIHCAAVSTFELFQDVTDERYEDSMNTNVRSAFYYIRHLLPDMIRRHSGRIILLSSVWGLVGASLEVLYSTTKAALIGMTKALAQEVGPSGITVNCIAPGVIDTDMNKSLDAAALSSICEDTPLGRLGTPEEVASLALYLCREGRFITGQVISPNGGYVIY